MKSGSRVQGKDFKSGLDMIIQSTAIVEEKDNQDIQTAIKEQQKKEHKEKEKMITIVIPISLKKEIKKYCANYEISIKDLIIRSVTKEMMINV